LFARLLALTSFSCVPITAWASDYTGFLPLMYLIVIVSLFTVINIGLILAFHSKGKYADRAFANKHVGLGAIIPLIGCLLSVSDYRNGHDLFITLGLNFIALLLVFIPLIIHKKNIQFSDNGGKRLLAVSSLLLLASLFIAPLSILSIFASHVAVRQLIGRWKNVGYTILVSGYVFICYWLFGILYIYTAVT
jgi:hypothetical protein